MSASVAPRRVIALHGFTGRGAAWDPVAEALERRADSRGGRAVRIDAPDLPGHRGRGDTDRPASFEQTVTRLFEELFPSTPASPWPPAERPILLGYSLGARLALGLLLEVPDSTDFFAGAVLCGVRSGLAGAEAEARVQADDALADRLERDGLRDFVDRWEQLPLFASQQHLADSPDGRAALVRQRRTRLAHDPHALAWVLRTLSPGRMPDYRPRLASLDLPIAVAVGALDDRFVEISHQAASALPNATLVVVPGAGHNLPLEAPEAVAEVISGLMVGALEAGGDAGSIAETRIEDDPETTPVPTRESTFRPVPTEPTERTSLP